MRTTLLALLTLLLILSGCGSKPAAPPGTAAFMTGTITQIEGSRVLIEERPGQQQGNKCWLAVDGQTGLFQQQGNQAVPLAADQLQVGLTVRAWAAGAVAESYPCQGKAAALVVQSPLR